MAAFGHNILSVFDAWDDSRDFLASMIESGVAPKDETRRLLGLSLLGGAEQWHALVECARSRQQQGRHRLGALDGQDVLAHAWAILTGHEDDGRDASARGRAWAETDRLIRLARELERDVEIRPPRVYEYDERDGLAAREPRSRKKRKRSSSRLASHYWPDEGPDGEEDIQKPISRAAPAISQPRLDHAQSQSVNLPSDGHAVGLPRISASLEDASAPPGCVRPALLHHSKGEQQQPPRKKRSTESPYFLKPTPPSEHTSGDARARLRSRPRRPPAGTVSCVPFPPLDAPSFGLIQEQVAREPFWLLIAITFLIKTSGKLAIPAFWRVKARFPAPRDLLRAQHQAELLGMIQHLGLPQVRLGYIHRYARAFLERPPTRGVRHRVRNYDRRDASPPALLAEPPAPGPPTPPAEAGLAAAQDPEAWEIGHMTQGKYALDSWRIFCRDELLGRAAGDGNGAGRAGGFQPEWMRTRPDDKELRAYLRWMWMREGWEWDPVTGERTVLREEMRRAVNEGRVEYDEAGGLRMLEADEARRGGGH